MCQPSGLHRDPGFLVDLPFRSRPLRCSALALWTVLTAWSWAPGWVVFCQRSGRATSGEELLGDGRGDVLGPGGAALGSPHPPVPFWKGETSASVAQRPLCPTCTDRCCCVPDPALLLPCGCYCPAAVTTLRLLLPECPEEPRGQVSPGRVGHVGHGALCRLLRRLRSLGTGGLTPLLIPLGFLPPPGLWCGRWLLGSLAEGRDRSQPWAPATAGRHADWKVPGCPRAPESP